MIGWTAQLESSALGVAKENTMEGQSREGFGETSHLEGRARKSKRKLGTNKDEGKEKQAVGSLTKKEN